jgi:hypothetical protein
MKKGAGGFRHPFLVFWSLVLLYQFTVPEWTSFPTLFSELSPSQTRPHQAERRLTMRLRDRAAGTYLTANVLNLVAIIATVLIVATMSTAITRSPRNSEDSCIGIAHNSRLGRDSRLWGGRTPDCHLIDLRTKFTDPNWVIRETIPVDCRAPYENSGLGVPILFQFISRNGDSCAELALWRSGALNLIGVQREIVGLREIVEEGFTGLLKACSPPWKNSSVEPRYLKLLRGCPLVRRK